MLFEQHASLPNTRREPWLCCIGGFAQQQTGKEVRQAATMPMPGEMTSLPKPPSI